MCGWVHCQTYIYGRDILFYLLHLKTDYPQISAYFSAPAAPAHEEEEDADLKQLMSWAQ